MIVSLLPLARSGMVRAASKRKPNLKIIVVLRGETTVLEAFVAEAAVMAAYAHS
jgi:hypothetical protein